MKLSFCNVFTILSLSALVSSHGWISSLTISNTTYSGYNPTIAPWVPFQNTITWPAWNTDTGPIYSSSLKHPDIICSVNATNTELSSAPIAAGDTVKLTWTTWPDSHHGPVISYLARCDRDCATVDKMELKWFKIAELGQLEFGAGAGTPGVWASDLLNPNNGTWDIAIPASIKAGSYVLRHEILALHSAYAVGEAQFYPQCVNVKVIGGRDVVPQGVVGTELYAESDPGVLYNIYNDETAPKYIMPGPKMEAF